MTATSPLLGLFKEQLEAECKALSNTYGLSQRGHGLIYWYFMRLHEFTEAEVAEVFCDGGGDLGIDAIWIDDELLVHFYQFKNPEDPTKGVPAGEIDKMLSGLHLILHQKHKQIANVDLKARLEDVYSQVPKGYRIHIVSSGAGVESETKHKLNAFVDGLKNPSATMVAWDEAALGELQEQFYQQSLPSVKEPIRLPVPITPYMLRSGVADCYLFSVSGEMLAQLYGEHKEGLLQRNIRVDQRETSTNRSIEATCTGADSMNFLHFNNGVTFLCETAAYDGFQRTLKLDKAQVVNGGQTIRALYRARQAGSLKSDVLVPARAISSSGDKDFANNVAVNQNNQNQVGTGFLRSNDKLVVQLDHALASLGWYLERREGELKSATEEEKASFQQRIGRPLDGRIIRLKEGAQAYTATFYGQPELAKKNVKKIFLSIDDGGHYEKIFSDMTAEKLVIAHQIKAEVDDFVKLFALVRRKFQLSSNPDDYLMLLGTYLSEKHHDVIHQVMPQCSLFLCGTIFKDLTERQKKKYTEIPEILETAGSDIIQTYLAEIIDYAKGNKDKADKSWPVLLKSNSFFNYVTAYQAGIHSKSLGKGES